MVVSSPDDGLRSGTARSQSFGASGWQGRAAAAVLTLALLSLLVRFVVLVQPRAMEFDQICTLLTASAHSWREYVAAVPADSQPPFSHVAARIGLLLPLPQSIGLHFVSALMTVLAAGCLFRLFQRRGAALAGACSAALFTSSRCVEYMFTLRPYAALMGVTALAVLVYDTYRTRRAACQKATLWPLALVIVLAASIHALSLVYVLLPILAGELLYLRETRRIDVRLLVAVGLASTAFVFDFALARLIQTHYMRLVPMSARTPGLPTLAKLYEVLTIPVERRWQLLLLAGVTGASLALWWRRRAGARERVHGAADPVFPLIAAGSIYVAGCFAFLMGAANHYFFTRYASPVFLCGPLLLGYLCALPVWRRFSLVLLGLAAILLLLPAPAFWSFVKEEPHRSPRESDAALFAFGDVIASPLAFPTLWWYATPAERQRLHLVTDPDRYRTIPDGIPEVVLQRFAAAGVFAVSTHAMVRLSPGPRGAACVACALWRYVAACGACAAGIRLCRGRKLVPIELSAASLHAALSGCKSTVLTRLQPSQRRRLRTLGSGAGAVRGCCWTSYFSVTGTRDVRCACTMNRFGAAPM